MIFDELLERHVGVFGKFQIFILVVLALEEVFMAMTSLCPMFLAATPQKYWCKHPQVYNDTIFGNCSMEDRLRLTVPPAEKEKDGKVNDGLSHCKVYDVQYPAGYDPCPLALGENDTTILPELSSNATSKCEEWVFDQSVYKSTVVTEWGLVCSTAREGQASTVASIFLAGRVVGNIIFGYLADRFGRKWTFLVSGILNTTTALVSAFVPMYVPFIILRFVQAIFGSGKSNTTFIWVMEFAGPSRRVHITALFFFFWAFGICVMSGLAYLFRDWRNLLLSLTVPEYLLYIVAYFIIPESPRWLYVKDRKEEADKVVAKMAKMNGTEVPKDLEVEKTVENVEKSPLDLVRTPYIRQVTFILLFVWCVTGFAYYGLTFSTSIFGDNIFFTTLISGAMEIPANILIIILFTYGGRIPTYTTCMFLCAFCMLTSMFLKDNVALNWLYLILVITGRTVITVVFNMAWIYTGECFPTCVRSLGISWTSIGARVTGPLGPFLLMLAVYYDLLPLIIIAGLTVTTGFLILMLPETKGRPMAQTIAGGEEFVRDNRIGCLRKRTPHSSSPGDGSPEEMQNLNKDGKVPDDKKNDIAIA